MKKDEKTKGNPILGRMLHRIADMVTTGDCGLDEDEANELIEIIATKKLSIEQSAKYLHMDRSKLRRCIREKKLPTPRKEAGTKKYYFKKDLMKLKKDENA